MSNYEDMRKTVVKFLKDSKMSRYDLLRISKDLCYFHYCKECEYFIQHYLKDGKEVDYGQCTRGSIVIIRKPNEGTCHNGVLKEDGNGTV